MLVGLFLVLFLLVVCPALNDAVTIQCEDIDCLVKQGCKELKDFRAAGSMSPAVNPEKCVTDGDISGQSKPQCWSRTSVHKVHGHPTSRKTHLSDGYVDTNNNWWVQGHKTAASIKTAKGLEDVVDDQEYYYNPRSFPVTQECQFTLFSEILERYKTEVWHGQIPQFIQLDKNGALDDITKHIIKLYAVENWDYDRCTHDSCESCYVLLKSNTSLTRPYKFLNSDLLGIVSADGSSQNINLFVYWEQGVLPTKNAIPMTSVLDVEFNLKSESIYELNEDAITKKDSKFIASLRKSLPGDLKVEKALFQTTKMITADISSKSELFVPIWKSTLTHAFLDISSILKTLPVVESHDSEYVVSETLTEIDLTFNNPGFNSVPTLLDNVRLFECPAFSKSINTEKTIKTSKVNRQTIPQKHMKRAAEQTCSDAWQYTPCDVETSSFVCVGSSYARNLACYSNDMIGEGMFLAGYDVSYGKYIYDCDCSIIGWSGSPPIDSSCVATSPCPTGYTVPACWAESGDPQLTCINAMQEYYIDQIGGFLPTSDTLWNGNHYNCSCQPPVSAPTPVGNPCGGDWPTTCPTDYQHVCGWWNETRRYEPGCMPPGVTIPEEYSNLGWVVTNSSESHGDFVFDCACEVTALSVSTEVSECAEFNACSPYNYPVCWNDGGNTVYSLQCVDTVEAVYNISMDGGWIPKIEFPFDGTVYDCQCNDMNASPTPTPAPTSRGNYNGECTSSCNGDITAYPMCFYNIDDGYWLNCIAPTDVDGLLESGAVIATSDYIVEGGSLNCNCEFTPSPEPPSIPFSPCLSSWLDQGVDCAPGTYACLPDSEQYPNSPDAYKIQCVNTDYFTSNTSADGFFPGVNITHGNYIYDCHCNIVDLVVFPGIDHSCNNTMFALNCEYPETGPLCTSEGLFCANPQSEAIANDAHEWVPGEFVKYDGTWRGCNCGAADMSILTQPLDKKRVVVETYNYPYNGTCLSCFGGRWPICYDNSATNKELHCVPPSAVDGLLTGSGKFVASASAVNGSSVYDCDCFYVGPALLSPTPSPTPSPIPSPSPSPVPDYMGSCDSCTPGKYPICVQVDDEYQLNCMVASTIDALLADGFNFIATEDYAVGDNHYDCDCLYINDTRDRTEPSPAPLPRRCRNKKSSIKMTCRKFSDAFPDMSSSLTTGLDTGIVLNALNPITRKPQWNNLANEGGNPSVTTQDNFDIWYNDVSDINTRSEVRMLVKNITVGGIDYHSYGGGSFYPLDDSPFDHEEYFTCEYHGWFTYYSGTTNIIALTSVNDAWLYIGGQLKMDMGGIHSSLTQSLNLNLLGLSNGTNYALDIFFAHRSANTASTFILNSTMCLTCPTDYDVCGTCNSPKDPVTSLPKYNISGAENYVCSDCLDPACLEDGDDVDPTDILLFKKLYKNLECGLTKDPYQDRVYNFDFTIDMEYPYSQPTGVVATLQGYNGNIRNRDQCDNLESDSSSNWNDISNLWNPTKSHPGAGDGLVDWSISSTFLTPHVRSIDLIATTSSENLYKCRDTFGNRLVDRERYSDEVASLDYTGVWYITRTSPVALENENLGEFPLYNLACSFRITESNNNTNAIVMQVKSEDMSDDGWKYHAEVRTTWVEQYCGEDGSIYFILRTCAFISNSADRWVELSNPEITFSQYGNSLTVSVNLLQSDSCDVFAEDDSHMCCQRWLLRVGSTDEEILDSIHNELEGNFYIGWDATITIINPDPSIHDSTPKIRSVRACLTVDIMAPCKTQDYLEAESSIDGTLEVYTDPDLETPYALIAGEYVIDGDTVYLGLTPNLSSQACSAYRVVVTRVVMYYNHSDGSQVSETYNVIFDRNNQWYTDYEPNIYAVDGECFAKIQFNMIKPDCYADIIYQVDGSHTPQGLGGPNDGGNFWDGDLGMWVHMTNDGEEEYDETEEPERKRSTEIIPDMKKRGTTTFIVEDSKKPTQHIISQKRYDTIDGSVTDISLCTIRIVVSWELDPLENGHWDKKRTILGDDASVSLVDDIIQEKKRDISDEDNDYDDDDYHERNHHELAPHAYVINNDRRVQVRCREGHGWDSEARRCMPLRSGFGLYNNWGYGLWSLIAMFIFVIFVIFIIKYCCKWRRHIAYRNPYQPAPPVYNAGVRVENLSTGSTPNFRQQSNSRTSYPTQQQQGIFGRMHAVLFNDSMTRDVKQNV